MATKQQIDAVYALLHSILETIQSAGEHGAPAGVMYAAMMGHMSLEQFETLMALLVKTGKVKRSGHCYYAVH